MNGTLSFEAVLTPEGIERDREIAFDDAGTITGISEGAPPWDGFLALPGMPNAHSHAFQRALAGRGEIARGDDSFWTWREEMYRLANAVRPEQAYAIARMAFVEMLAAGFTHLAEFHYLLHGPDGARGTEMTEAVVAAAADVGLPLTLLPVYYRTAGFDGAPVSPQQRRFAHDSVDDFLATVERLGEAVGGIAPHSLRAVPAQDFGPLLEGAATLPGGDGPLHIHVSEQTAEVDECLARHGRTPIRYLFDHVDPGPRWHLVHATHASPEERRAIRDAGVTVILCPLTEAYLGDGLFEAREHRAAAGTLAIGTDSNVRISAIEELRMLEYGQRLRDRLRARLGDDGGVGAPLWAAMAAGGARAAGRDIGRIATGARADFVILRRDSGPLAGHDPETALDAWLVGGDSTDIAAVYVAGRRVVDHGSTPREDEIRAAFARTVRELRG